MENHEVISAFEMLLDELDDVVRGLNQEGAKLLTTGNYNEARTLIAQAESITTIREKVESLSDEWCELSVKPVKKTSKKMQRRKPMSTTRLRKGLRTTEESYKLPLLKTLIEMGGAGKVADVLDRIEKRVTPILTEHDYELLMSSNEPRWRNTVKWARQALVNEGKLDPKSPYGVWTITEQGRAWAEEQSEEVLSQILTETQKTMVFPKEKTERVDKSVTLQQIIEVCVEMFDYTYSYNEAVKLVAKRRGLNSIHTVYDKCTRQLGLTTEEFKALTKDKFQLMKFLIDRFPDEQYYIIEQLGS